MRLILLVKIPKYPHSYRPGHSLLPVTQVLSVSRESTNCEHEHIAESVIPTQSRTPFVRLQHRIVATSLAQVTRRNHPADCMSGLCDSMANSFSFLLYL